MVLRISHSNRRLVEVKNSTFMQLYLEMERLIYDQKKPLKPDEQEILDAFCRATGGIDFNFEDLFITKANALFASKLIQEALIKVQASDDPFDDNTLGSFKNLTQEIDDFSKSLPNQLINTKIKWDQNVLAQIPCEDYQIFIEKLISLIDPKNNFFKDRIDSVQIHLLKGIYGFNVQLCNALITLSDFDHFIDLIHKTIEYLQRNHISLNKQSLQKLILLPQTLDQFRWQVTA